MSYPQPPMPPKPRRSVNDIVITAAAALIVGGAIGFVAGKSTVAPIDLAANPVPAVTVTEKVSTVITVGPTPPAAKPATTPPPAPKPKPTIDDGKVVVGDDIPAGVYEVRGAPSDCYYEITKHGTSDIIDNSFGTGGHLTVTLKVGQDFETEGCGIWTKK